MALNSADELLERDVTVVDVRDLQRPMARLTEHAVEELAKVKAAVAGEDA